MKASSAPPRGMRDFLPSMVELRQHAEGLIESSYRRFGFRRVETPALESLRFLTSGEGGDNEKLIFKVLKRGEKLDLDSASRPDDLADYGLRYDLTVPLARYYAEHQAALPEPFKAIQIGPVWRAERPQKGRFRQFTQCDIDVLGDPTVLAEIELIQAGAAALAALGLEGFEVRLNDRRLLSAMVAACGFDPESASGVFIILDKLDKIGPEGVDRELRGSGHAGPAVEALLALLERAGSAEDALETVASALPDGDARAAAAVADLGRIRDALEGRLASGTRLRFDPALVRGMGYYTGPIFEVGLEGVGYSVAGGGRYDRMIGGILGREVPACGLSIGFERIVLLLEERGLVPRPPEPRLALLIDPGRDDPGAVLDAAGALRAEGRAVTVVPRRKKTARQIEELGTQGYQEFAFFTGEGTPEVRAIDGS